MSPRKKPEPEPLTSAPFRSRGYYKTPHGRFRSVTTILDGGFPKPALIGWTGREVANCALDSVPWLSTLRGDEARDDAAIFLKRAGDRLRDASAKLGSEVHHYLEQRALGAPTVEPTEEQAPFFAAIDDFLNVMAPEWEASELVVANTVDKYAGTGDGWLSFPRHKVTYGDGVAIIDAKSGRNTWGEASMQLSAYRRADVGWLRDGTEVVPPEAKRGFVLHVRPDAYPERGWALVPARTDDEIYRVFLHVKAVSEANGLISNRALGDPLPITPDDELAEQPQAPAEQEGAA